MYPEVIYLYKDGNKDEGSWRVAIDPDKLPKDTKIGVYNYSAKMKIKVNVKMVEDIDDVVVQPEPPPVEEPPV